MYAHLRADTGDIFYIGKGTGNRAWTESEKSRTAAWGRVAREAGGFYVKILEDHIESEGEALCLEREYICEHKQYFDLVNVAHNRIEHY